MSEQKQVGVDSGYTLKERGAAWQALFERFGEVPVPFKEVWKIQADLTRALATQPEPPSAELLRAAKAVVDYWIKGQYQPGIEQRLIDALSRAESAGPVRDDAVLNAKLECVQRIRNFAAAYIDNCNAASYTLEQIQISQSALMEASNNINAWARGLTPHPAQPSLDALNRDDRALLPEGEKAHG